MIKVGEMISQELITYHNSSTKEIIDIYNNILGKLYKEKIKNIKTWDCRCQSFFGIIYCRYFSFIVKIG